jgi:hypothetical protein
MAISNFLKNQIQDLIWRGKDAEIAGAGFSISGSPVYYLGLVGGAQFPNMGAMLRSTAYQAGQYAWPHSPNGRLYKCTTAGTTGPNEPSWLNVEGAAVTDGTVTWEEQSLALANGDIPEPEGNGYERQPWLCSLSTVMGGNLSTSGGASSGARGVVANLAQIQFPMAQPNEWGPIWGIALFDADDGGELLFTSPCVIPKVVGANDQLAFAGGTPNTAYGAIQITLE